MDNQPDDSSKVKTHEEILRLFKEVLDAEAKVRDPEHVKQNQLETHAFLPEMEPPQQDPEETLGETSPQESFGEIPPKKVENHRRSFFKRIETTEGQPEKKSHWFGFLDQEHDDITDLEPDMEDVQPEEEKKPPSSTFTLQLDTNGNLIGFPLKKPKIEHERKGWFASKRHPQTEGGDTEDETEEGFKGKLTHFFSTFRRSSSEETEASEGIGEKIKGIFRRKNKE